MKLSKHIALCGMPGSGKSTVGKQLARRLQCPFVDLDELIEEEEGMSISEIFRTKGEAAFREMELRYLSLLLQGAPAIIALGGGALSTQKLFELLARDANLIYLSVPIQVLVDRLKNERALRPLLANEDWQERLLDLEQRRKPIFEKAPTRIDGAQNVEIVVENIIKQLK